MTDCPNCDGGEWGHTRACWESQQTTAWLPFDLQEKARALAASPNAEDIFVALCHVHAHAIDSYAKLVAAETPDEADGGCSWCGRCVLAGAPCCKFSARLNKLREEVRIARHLQSRESRSRAKLSERFKNFAEAAKKALVYVEQWVYEDRGCDYNECPSCGWNTKHDRTPDGGLGHRPGCELHAALKAIEDNG